jgi:hypothetical protein
MVTRKEVREAFEEDGAYTLIKDFLRHILEVKKRYRFNDIGTEEICQFIKYANFDEEDWAVFRRDVARKEETPNAI